MGFGQGGLRLPGKLPGVGDVHAWRAAAGRAGADLARACVPHVHALPCLKWFKGVWAGWQLKKVFGCWAVCVWVCVCGDG